MKKLISLLLALTLSISMLGVSAQAANGTPFALTATQNGDTVTLSLKTDSELSYANLTLTLTCPDGFTLTSINEGKDYADFGVSNIVSNPGSGITAITARNLAANTTVAANKEFLTYTVDAASATPGSYTFSLELTTAADIDGKKLSWQGSSFSSNSITVENTGSDTHTHTYGDPVWVWTGNDEEGYTEAAVTLNCTGEGTCDWTDNQLSGTAVPTMTQKDATCTVSGNKTWTAAVTLNGRQYTDTKTVTIPAAGHTLTKTEAKAPTCTEDGNHAYWTCDVCGWVFSDEAGATRTTVEAQRIPANGHTYVDGECAVCGAVQGSFEVYYELYDAAGTTKLTTDADNDGKLDVKAGESYVAKVFVKPNADQKLRGFELNLTYDSANMTVADDTSFNAVHHDKAAVADGTVHYVLYQAGNATAAYYPMTANTGLQVAQFTFTLKDAVAADTTMTFGFGAKNEIGVVNDESADAVPATTTPSSVDTLGEITVTWNANGGKFGEAESTTTKVAYGQAAVAPSDPTRGGYTLVGWYDATDNDQTVITEFPVLYAAAEYAAKWETTTYAITPNLDGGTLPDGSSMTDYTIESGVLPTPTKPGYIFDGWKVTSVEGDSNLTVGETVTSLTGKYGNVTLAAQWTVNAYCAVVDYKYANTNYALLIVSAVPGDGNVVQYNGTQMYHIAAADAAAYVTAFTTAGGTVVRGASGVYVTLIPYTQDTVVSADQVSIVAGMDETLAYNCQIDNDNDVDFNDASIVYQMVRTGGDAFKPSALGIKARLLADANHDCKGTLDDVNLIAQNFM